MSRLTLCDPLDCSLPGSSPWNSPGKNIEVGCHFLLQGIFPTRGLNPYLLHCRQIPHHLSHQGNPTTAARCRRRELREITSLLSSREQPTFCSALSDVVCMVLRGDTFLWLLLSLDPYSRVHLNSSKGTPPALGGGRRLHQEVPHYLLSVTRSSWPGSDEQGCWGHAPS